MKIELLEEILFHELKNDFEHMYGLLVKNMKESGRKIKWIDLVHILTQIEINLYEFLKTDLHLVELF
jgi:hypothetical protein